MQTAEFGRTALQHEGLIQRPKHRHLAPFETPPGYKRHFQRVSKENMTTDLQETHIHLAWQAGGTAGDPEASEMALDACVEPTELRPKHADSETLSIYLLQMLL